MEFRERERQTRHSKIKITILHVRIYQNHAIFLFFTHDFYETKVNTERCGLSNIHFILTSWCLLNISLRFSSIDIPWIFRPRAFNTFPQTIETIFTVPHFFAFLLELSTLAAAHRPPLSALELWYWNCNWRRWEIRRRWDCSWWLLLLQIWHLKIRPFHSLLEMRQEFFLAVFRCRRYLLGRYWRIRDRSWCGRKRAREGRVEVALLRLRNAESRKVSLRFKMVSWKAFMWHTHIK